MERLRLFGSFAIALLSLLMVAAGAPAVACVAMPECPMMASTDDCHGSGHDRGCTSPRLETGDDCCGVTTAPPLPAPSSEAPILSLAIQVAGAAGQPFAALAVPPPVPGVAPVCSRPAGRALLSLEQTFLI